MGERKREEIFPQSSQGTQWGERRWILPSSRRMTEGEDAASRYDGKGMKGGKKMDPSLCSG